MSGYQKNVRGLADLIASVKGMSAKQVYDHLPKAIAPVKGRPVMLLLLDQATRNHAAQTTRMEYEVIGRLCFLWKDNPEATKELQPFVNSIPAAIDRSFLQGQVNPLWTALTTDNAGYSGGAARVSSVRVVFVTVTKVEYLALDFRIHIWETFRYQTAGL